MIVLLDNIRSGHNVGSIMRTCDALGIREIHLCGITPDLSDKKVSKTALGAQVNLQIIEKTDTYTDIQELKSLGYTIVGLEVSKAAVDVSEFEPPEKLALVVGNEVSGLSDETLKQCDAIVQIAMKGIKESLNVSVAFGIAAYELTKN